MLIHRLATLTGLAVITLFMAAPANALTMAECSTKYNTAKDAGTLAGQTWNQFRKAECGTDASATTAETTTAKKPATATDAAKADTAKAAATDDGKRPDGQGMQHQISGCQGRRHAQRHEMERLPQDRMRRRRFGRGRYQACQDHQGCRGRHGSADGAKGLTTKECSTKYQAAKAAGTLNGMKWNDFRKTECAAGASAAADTKPAKTTKAAAAATAPADDAKGLTTKECGTKYQAAKAAGTLNGMKWNDFRKSECGAGASAAAEPAKATTKAADPPRV